MADAALTPSSIKQKIEQALPAVHVVSERTDTAHVRVHFGEVLMSVDFQKSAR